TLNLPSGSLTVNFLSAPTPGNTYRLVNYTGGSVGALSANSRASLSVGTSTAGQVNVTVNSYSAGNLTWNGAGSNWDLSASANWKNTAGGADLFFQLDSVTFADSATAPTSVNLTTFVAPGSFVANATSTNYTLTGPGTIGGGAGITKTGASVFTVDTN